MFFFNLSAVEFLALLGTLSSFVVVLYLLDRSRKKHLVPTLRFWQDSEMPAQKKHRRKIQQPWSLILQLIGIVLPGKADAGKESANKLPAGQETTAKGSKGKDAKSNPLL